MQNLDYFRRVKEEKQAEAFSGISFSQINQVNKYRADSILSQGMNNYRKADMEYERHKSNIGLYGFSVNATR